MIDLSAEESSEISLDGTVFLFAPAEATGHVLCMLGTMWKSLAVPQICVSSLFLSLGTEKHAGTLTNNKIMCYTFKKKNQWASDTMVDGKYTLAHLLHSQSLFFCVCFGRLSFALYFLSLKKSSSFFFLSLKSWQLVKCNIYFNVNFNYKKQLQFCYHSAV